MRLIGFLADGVASIGLVREGQVGLLAAVDDFYADVQGALGRARDVAFDRPLAEVRQVPAVPSTAKVVCVGLNYRSHAAEAGIEVPAYPTIFARWPSTLIVDGDSMPVPPGEAGLDWEGELAVVVGQRMYQAEQSQALSGVLGYAVFNDASARHHQLQTSQWTLGKNADRTAPFGPVIVTTDEITDVGALRLETRVNGEVVQSASAKEMIFSIPDILCYVTETITLKPGDVIATGTPEGVGLGRTPQWYLKPGDVVEVEIDAIGVLRNPVVAHDLI